MIRSRSYKKGITLVEAIVGIGILAFAIAGPMTLASRGLRTSQGSRNELVATHLAEEGIEIVHSVRDNNSAHDSADDALKKGLMGNWWFDETGGAIAYDASENGNNGTLVGGVGRSALGKIQSALVFNGATSYVQAPDQLSLEFVGGPITVAAWVNPSQISTYGVFLDKTNSSLLSNYALRQSATGDKLEFFYRNDANTAWDVWQSNPSIFTSIGTWHHVAITYTFGDGTSIKAYVDGVPILGAQGHWVVGTGDELPDSSAGPLYLGVEQAIHFFSGKLDDVRIYNRILSPEEISNLASYNGYSALWLNNILGTCTTGCIANPTVAVTTGGVWDSSALTSCAVAACKVIYFNPITGMYAQPAVAPGAPWVPTQYTRIIKLVIDPANDPLAHREVGVVSTVTYPGFGNITKTVVASDVLDNWFPALQ